MTKFRVVINNVRGSDMGQLIAALPVSLTDVKFAVIRGPHRKPRKRRGRKAKK